MKPVRLRPRAREDRRSEVRWYRGQGGPKVALRLVTALDHALDTISRHPGIGSPVLGEQLGVEGMRTWLIDGFPLVFWYFERETHVEIARLVGQRQDAFGIDPNQP